MPLRSEPGRATFEIPLIVRKNEQLSLQRRIARTQLSALIIRNVAVGWEAFAGVTFIWLSLDSTYPQARPIFIGGSFLFLAFLAFLAAPIKPDLRRRLPRALMVLRWQVATGVVIAFTVAAGVRPDLRVPVGIYGIYLLLPVVFVVALSFLDLRLRNDYREAETLARNDEHAELMRALGSLSDPLYRSDLRRSQRRVLDTARHFPQSRSQ